MQPVSQGTQESPPLPAIGYSVAQSDRGPAGPGGSMARPRKTTDKPATSKRRIEQYDHKGQQRKNNPPVGLVTEATDRDAPKHRYISVQDRSSNG